MQVKHLPSNAMARLSSDGDRPAVTLVPLDGEWVAGHQVMRVEAPYDGRLLGVVPAFGVAEVDRAVAGARTALDTPFPSWRRAEVLDRAAVRLAGRGEEFARCIALESAKPIRTARAEVRRAVSTLVFSAAVARGLTGETVPLEAAAAGEGKIGFTLRVPVGVVGAIAPFNFPLNLVVHKLGPAIAAGCPVVLKPAEQTPFSSVLLAELLIDECGLPPGYLHVIPGDGPTVGGALVDHPDVALITFTGSPDVGWAIRQRAPRKRVSLELGGNAPVIIEPDSDWRDAVAKIAVAGFSHAGQSCVSTQRVLVHAGVVREVITALTEAVERLVVGDPLDEATDVSALISHAARDRVIAWIDEAVAQGARVATGGDVTGDGVLRPTVLVDARPSMKVCAEEVFGPVVAVTAYGDFAEALRMANDTRFGLQAGVYTADLGKALTAARVLDYGGVLINAVPTWRVDHQPYGGKRDSGNTREGPAWAVREMTEERLIVLAG
ncbi:aldehyde dehydrogenase family protein [Micromonospora sp. NPDC092111]|uniref:aldehyde dehydrogenase family protein n=1 Tax=Micromonospora sp. NPDC092111 TaxID=3364289 RepID=UPI0037F24144